MIFIGISKEFSLENEEQYNTIGDFWDELSNDYGLENLQGLGYKWENNKIFYAIGLKNGIIKDANFQIELPDNGWYVYNGETDNLKVIYDAAHAFNETYKGVSVANFGDISMFSFHATKVFNTIEGGCLTFNDDLLKVKINSLKNFGMVTQESYEYIGGNAKMNEFQAAMGLCNLRHLDEQIAKRKQVVDRYTEKLCGVDGLKLSLDQKDVEYNYSYFPVIFDGFKYTRDEIFEKLKQNGITARKYFYPLTNSFEAFNGKYNVMDTPIANDIANKVLTLPLYADLELDDVDLICDIILK